MTEPEVRVDRLTSLAELQSCAADVARQTQHRLTIFTPDLEPDLYNTTAFVNQCLHLLKRSRHTEILILIQDTRSARECSHGMLRLMQYSDHQIQIRKSAAAPNNPHLAYLIGDQAYLLRRQDARLPQGLCYTGDRARVKHQLEEFELLWRHAPPDPDIRSLSL